MRRETRDRQEAARKAHEQRAGETLEQQLARLSGLVAAPQLIEQPSLPSEQVLMVTMTMDELHDLIYAATSTYLQTLSSMPKAKAQMHGRRVAETGRQIALGQDYTHRGIDPRG